MDQSKDDFLAQFGADYGYPDAPRGVDEMRAADFKRLQGTVYLDHVGATLYSEAQMADVVKDLTSNVYGNPHSQGDSSMAASDLVTAARHQHLIDWLVAGVGLLLDLVVQRVGAAVVVVAVGVASALDPAAARRRSRSLRVRAAMELSKSKACLYPYLAPNVGEDGCLPR